MPTFVVEDGTVVADATSYCTLAFADDYLSVKPAATIADWEALTDDEKEAFLMWATRLMDQRVRWRGTLADPDSALQWPRNGVYDRNGNLIPNDEVPLQVQQATVEIAFHLLNENVDPSAPGSAAAGGIKSQKLGPLEIVYQDNAVFTPNYFPVGINQLLSPLGSLPGGGSSAARIIRA
jgi:hypothetical protein